MNSDIERGGLGRGRVRRAPAAGVIALAAGILAGAGESVRADWAPVYSIERVGLYGPGYVHPDGFARSQVTGRLDRPWVYGTSHYYAAPRPQSVEVHPWMWSQATGTVRVGLWGGMYIGMSNLPGLSFAANDIGWSGGASLRLLGTTDLGADAWVCSPEGVSMQVGPTGPEYSRPDGYRYSSVGGMMVGAVRAVGSSSLFASDGTANGWCNWVWTPEDGVSPIGLVGPAYTGTTGYRYSVVDFILDDAVVGYSTRVGGVNTSLGADWWRWTPQRGTELLGLTGPEHLRANGARITTVIYMGSPSLIRGSTRSYASETTSSGTDSWVWTPPTGTVRTGLYDESHVFPGGTRFHRNVVDNRLNCLAGTSARYTAAAGSLSGYDAWIWTATTGTVRVGLLGPEYGSDQGFRNSEPRYAFADGSVLGFSSRGSGSAGWNGQDVWLWTPTGGTRRVSPSGGIYQSPTGRQFAEPSSFSERGLICGSVSFYSASGVSLGSHVWRLNGQDQPEIIGPRSAEYTGPNGEQYSQVNGVGADGVVYGVARRFRSDGTALPQGLWCHTPAAGTVEMGLMDPPHLDSHGVATNTLLNLFSARGRSILQETGKVFGESTRWSGSGTSIGSDLWMFDPRTQTTVQITPGVPSAVRASDGAARAGVTTVTEDGFILGWYDSYRSGTATAGRRLFSYRADVGFADLGDLVVGGLIASGCALLQNVVGATMNERLILSGNSTEDIVPPFYSSNPAGTVFVMRPIPAPVCPADVTGDRTVDGADFVAFVNSFSLGDAATDNAADLNRDGTIDGGDFVAFMAAFAAGC